MKYTFLPLMISLKIFSCNKNISGYPGTIMMWVLNSDYDKRMIQAHLALWNN